MLSAIPAYAEDISLNLTVSAEDDHVSVRVENTGRDVAKNIQIEIELEGLVYQKSSDLALAPGRSEEADFEILLPDDHGSYPLRTRVSYDNQEQRVTVLDVGYFNFIRSDRLEEEVEFNDVEIRNVAGVRVNYNKKYKFSLVVPPEIEVQSKKEYPEGTVFFLKNTLQEFSSDYAFFGVLESAEGERVHKTKVFDARLKTVRNTKAETLFSLPVFLFTALLASLASVYFLTRSDRPNKVVLARASFSIFTVSVVYILFYGGGYLADLFFNNVFRASLPSNALGTYLWLVLSETFSWLYFDGTNYDNFFKYFADALFIYVLFLNYFVLNKLVKPQPKTDKYWSLMLSFFSLFSKNETFKKFDSRLVKVAVLSLCVKSFYLPVFLSWCVNNVEHHGNLFSRFSFETAFLFEFAVASLIFIDVAVFCFGYLTELPQLRNTIKSVEPTLIGWVVCLMCYPPFNQYSFKIVDVPLLENWEALPYPWSFTANTVILISWIVYVWATIALGARASNLTNRGIISKGPYAFCRHPAYASKLLVWIMTGVFFATMNFFLVFALVLVYWMRAWTEERHLSSDPDYREYQKKVPWWFCPGVF